MAEHHAAVRVNAPVHQVYALFTHFNDFPKFMSFVKEVTYYDEQRSHWVSNVLGTHEWDAVNEGWIVDQQIGWRSTSGLENSGKVKFTPVGSDQTMVDVFVYYTPPAGLVGNAVETLGFSGRFDTVLQKDLDHFSHMVEQAPVGALDPMQSHYLFHNKSIMAKGKTTDRQQESMQQDPMMTTEALQTRSATLSSETSAAQQVAREQEEQQPHQKEQEQMATHDQEEKLKQQDKQNQSELAQEQAAVQDRAQQRELDPVYDTIGGRNASMDRTSFGDQDAQSERFPDYHADPMLSRAPGNAENIAKASDNDDKIESPWRNAIRGASPEQKGQEESNKPEDKPTND
jgi:ribosome-associated toxin RatA of RatAB toxin-antitoxin module